MSESFSQTGNRNGNETSFAAPYYMYTTVGPSLVLGMGLVRTLQILELERDVDACGYVT